MSQFLRFLRTVFKLIKVVVVTTTAFFGYFFMIKLPGKSGSLAARANWLRSQSHRYLWALGIEAHYVGEPPAEGVLVSNHLSYIDILVHGARMPLTFISKAEVARWPIFGLLTRCAGTLFIRREVRSDVMRLVTEMPSVLQAGVVLAFFPEGTSSGGDIVRPFRTPLLQPLVENGWKVTPAFLCYELEPGDGVVKEEVAWYRPETLFGTHFLNLLGKRRIRATVTYGETQSAGTDRKMLASRLREEICIMGRLPAETEMLAERA